MLPLLVGDIHDACHRAAEEYGASRDYLAGANIAGFQQVAEVILAHGVI